MRLGLGRRNHLSISRRMLHAYQGILLFDMDILSSAIRSQFNVRQCVCVANHHAPLCAHSYRLLTNLVTVTSLTMSCWSGGGGLKVGQMTSVNVLSAFFSRYLLHPKFSFTAAASASPLLHFVSLCTCHVHASIISPHISFTTFCCLSTLPYICCWTGAICGICTFITGLLPAWH